MADLVNLRLARKRAARRDKAARSDANRIASGLSKGEKTIARRERDRADRRLDDSRIAAPAIHPPASAATPDADL